MKKTIRLTESDLIKLVKKIINEETMGGNQYTEGKYEYNFLDSRFNPNSETSRAELEIIDVSKSPNDWVFAKVPTFYELYPVEGHPGVFSHPNLKDEQMKYIKIYKKGEQY